VFTGVPPVAAVYQLSVPPVHPFAERVITPGPHIDAGTTVGGEGKGLMVTVTVVVFTHPFASVPVTV